MKRKIILGFCFGLLLTSNFNLAHADVEQRRAELIKVLDEELREVVRLNKQIGGTRPDLMLRMGQVLLEKGRLLKDQENQKFLEIPQERRTQVNADEHFKESRKYFDQAQKTVLVLLKKFPKFEDRGDAYYILAYNAKELKQDEESRKFFQRAIDESRSDSLIANKSRIALAETYFNKGSFDKSLVLYEAALKQKRDKWWTKDAFNLSWCYFKVGKFDRAIDLMKEAYELSKSSKYIDMSKSIERDIAFFYTEAGRSEEAIQFYRNNGKNVSEILLKVGKFLKNQGKYTAAEKTLIDALKLKQTEREETDINIELLSLFEKFGRYDKHLESCKVLGQKFDKGLLNADQIDVLKFNVQKVGAVLQQQIVSKTFDHQPDVRDKKAEASTDYFTIEAKIEPKKAQESMYHAGETYFSIGKFDRAVPFYAEAIKLSRQNNDKKTEGLAGNALMVSLGKGVKKEIADKYLVPAYESYLSANPNGDKASVVYQRLFTTHMEKKNIPEAEKVLINYKNSLPAENETQEKMLAQVMDYYKDKGDKTALMNWSKRIDAKEFKVSSEYSKKVKELMLGMQFEKVEEANSKGDKKGALKGYFQIYKAEDTTPDAKKMAAYNIAVLFYDTGDWKQMYNWADRALSMMNATDVSKFDKDFILFSTDLFQRRQFTESASLSEKSFDKMCSTESVNKKVFFKNANVIYISEKQFDKSKNLIAKARNCKLPNDVVLGGNLDHLNELAVSNKWTSFYETLTTLESSKEMWPFLIYPSSLLANELDTIGKTEDSQKLRSKMNSFYENSQKQKIDIPLEALDAIAQMRLVNLDNQLAQFKSMKLKFPEKEYNKLLKMKFAKLEKLTSDSESVANIGSGMGILRAYRVIIEGHEQLKNEISNFNPEGKPEDYVKSFKKTMLGLAGQLDKQSRDFRNVAVKKIETDSILSKDNIWFMNNKNDSILAQFFNIEGGMLMDKAGAK
jgi:tetratricopeptide (TPR) repeat protein